jgi:hypothetical protein
LHLRVAFGGQQPDLATLQTEVFEKQADLRRAAFDASQGCEHRDRFVERLRRMRLSLRFNGVSMRTQQALWAMEVALFQGFHAACMIQLQIGSQGIGRDGAQWCDLVMRSTLTLEPQGFHPLRHARMRMMVALIVQRLFVCLTAFESEHPLGHPFG